MSESIESVRPAVKGAVGRGGGRGKALDRGANGAPHEAATALAADIALSVALDGRLDRWQRQGLVGSFVPASPWEAALAATAAAAKADDWIFPGVTESRIALFRGLPLEVLIAQHLGLGAAQSDPQISQAGHASPGTVGDAAHLVADPPGGLGAHLLHAVGAALAAKSLQKSQAVVVLAAAEAADTDDCHAALNFAAVYRVPVVFVFRSTPERSAASLVERASGYALPASSVAGSDPQALRDRLGALLDAAREGRGPSLLALEAIAESSGTQVEPEMLADAERRCDEAFAAARRGQRPAQLIQGVFSESTWPLLAQARDLAGEPWADPDTL